MRLPDFLIVGAAKSGTTSLYHFLGQHPDIFMSAVKELGFFALKNDVQFNGPGDMNAIGCCSVNTLEAYSALFAEARGGVAAGESSNMYLYSQEAPHAIKAAIPNVKLIAILRDPVERAVLNRICAFVGVRPWRFSQLTANRSRDPRKWPPSRV